MRNVTNAPNEALHLAFRNGFIVLSGDGDASHRIYGCLYGLDKYGDNVIAKVPSRVTYASLIQKLFAGLAIFLIGLGLRNKLRMR